MPQDTARALGSRQRGALQSRRFTDCVVQLRWPVPHLGHGQRPVSENTNRRRQSARVVCQILAQRQVHFGRHARQHPEAVGLLEGQMPQDVHRTQERKVLHFRQFLSHRRKGIMRKKRLCFVSLFKCVFLSISLIAVDCVGQRGQHGVHLEPAEQRNCAASARPHGHRAVHRLPSDGEHYCIGRAGK